MMLHLLIASLLLCYIDVVQSTSPYHEDNAGLAWSDPGSPLDFTEWTQSILNPQELYITIQHLALRIHQDHSHHRIAIIKPDSKHYHIKGVPVIEISPTNYNQKTIALKLLQLIYNWYLSTSQTSANAYHRKKSKSKLTLIQSVMLICDQSHTTRTDISILMDCRKILDNLDKLLDQIKYNQLLQLLHIWLFYEPYLEIIDPSKNVQFLKVLGTESSASVILIKHHVDRYALKIVKSSESSSCKNEEYVLKHITRYMAKPRSFPMNVPQLIQLENITINCALHNAILMQYIPGTDLTSMDISPQSPLASILLDELTPTITNLATIGVGHFDINTGNIIQDVSGKWWLIDFGLAHTLNMFPPSHPIIGTWPFYSPFAYKLELWRQMYVHQNRSLRRDQRQWIELTKNANVFSLQMNILYKLGRNNATKWNDITAMMLQQCCVLNNVWTHGKKVDVKMFGQLQPVWSAAAQSVYKYFERNDDTVYLNRKMFDLITMNGVNDTVFTPSNYHNEAISDGVIQKKKKNRHGHDCCSVQ